MAPKEVAHLVAHYGIENDPGRLQQRAQALAEMLAGDDGRIAALEADAKRQHEDFAGQLGAFEQDLANNLAAAERQIADALDAAKRDYDARVAELEGNRERVRADVEQRRVAAAQQQQAQRATLDAAVQAAKDEQQARQAALLETHETLTALSG